MKTFILAALIVLAALAPAAHADSTLHVYRDTDTLHFIGAVVDVDQEAGQPHVIVIRVNGAPVPDVASTITLPIETEADWWIFAEWFGAPPGVTSEWLIGACKNARVRYSFGEHHATVDCRSGMVGGPTPPVESRKAR